MHIYNSMMKSTAFERFECDCHYQSALFHLKIEFWYRHNIKLIKKYPNVKALSQICQWSVWQFAAAGLAEIFKLFSIFNAHLQETDKVGVEET